MIKLNKKGNATILGYITIQKGLQKDFVIILISQTRKNNKERLIKIQ